jgi:hypothetical protein
MKHFVFQDYLNVKPAKVLDNAKRMFETKDASSETGYSLMVVINATHSGLVTLNNGLYLPYRMRSGLPTFTYPYQKPWLLHHDDEKPSVGRVIKGRYVSLADQWNDQTVTLLDQGGLNRKQEIQAIRKLMPRLIDQNNPGMGYAQLLVKVTDKDAIQKVLEGNYLTVSTRQKSDSAACSLCGQDWGDPNNDCEHWPGMKDKSGNKCFAITSNLVYMEGSFVNIPADQWAQVIQIVNDQDEVVDSIKIIEEDENRQIFSIGFDLFSLTDKDTKMNLIGASEDLAVKAGLLEFADSFIELETSEDKQVTQEENDNGGNDMKDLKTILSNPEIMVEEINKKLSPSASKLTLSDLVRRLDSDFIKGRSLPVFSQDLANAAIELLKEFKDAEAQELSTEIQKVLKAKRRSEIFDAETDEELTELYDVLVDKIATRKMERPWPDSMIEKTEYEKVKTELADALANYKTMEETVAQEQETHLDYLRKTLGKLAELNESPFTEDDLNAMDHEKVVAEISLILDKVEEEPPTLDPTLSTDASKAIEETVSVKYFELKDSKGPSVADTYLYWQKRDNIVSKNFTPKRK